MERHRSAGHYQPARDDRRMGPPDVGTRLQCDRVAGSPHGRLLRRAARTRSDGAYPRKDGIDSRRLLLGDQNPLDSRQRTRRTRARRAGRTLFRHGRFVARMAAFGRAAPHHRRIERLAHDALRHPHPRLGRRTARPVRHPALDAARSRTHERRIRHDRLPAGTGADPDRLAGGRPAGRAFRAAVHRPLLGQDDLRHGMLHHAQYGRPAPRLGQQPAGHRGVAARRQDDLCARRKRLRGRFGHPMAARRVETLLLVGRFGTAGASVEGYGRRLSGTGTDGTGRSLLGPLCPRHDRRHHARHDLRAHHPGRRSKRSPSRSTTWYAPWRPIRDTPRPRCASTAVPWPTAC